MLGMKWFFGFALALLIGTGAWAQPTPQVASTAVGGVGVPTVGIYCIDSSGYAQICSFGGGSGGGGAVTAASGSYVDGALVSLGTKADAAWSGTGPASEIAIEKAIFGALVAPLPAGTNALGSVGVTSLPAIPAGTNAIGSVSVSALPALPAGSNAIGSVSVSALPTLPAGTNVIGSVTLNYGGSVVSSSNLLGVTDTALDGIITGGKLPVSSTANNSPGTSGSTATSVQGVTGGVPVPISTPSNLPVYLQAVNSGLGGYFSTQNAASSTIAINVKSSGTAAVFGYHLSNSCSQGVWLRFFSTTGTPTVGAGTVLWRAYAPPTSAVTFAFDMAFTVASGLGITATAGAGDTDTTAITTANCYAVNITYK